MKSYETVGYAYEGAAHCVTCAQFRFGIALEDELEPPLDDEGNEVHPIFAGDESAESECSDCADLLVE